MHALRAFKLIVVVDLVTFIGGLTSICCLELSHHFLDLIQLWLDL